ncbi:MAG: AtpZ/AtpI family protein [Alphaproteobacteria bacterium]|nr:MAG: AtpZ/AtpI family protein [Alphaproteobacteria bacterium]
MTGRHDEERRRDIEEAVKRHRTRRAARSAEGERPLWRDLSMIGALGWLIVLPALAGVFTGRWVDTLLGSGVTFSTALTLAGVCLGFWMAWKRMHAE